jgi:hypothetical protein
VVCARTLFFFLQKIRYLQIDFLPSTSPCSPLKDQNADTEAPRSYFILIQVAGLSGKHGAFIPRIRADCK